ncbi:prepilin peptidase [Pseudobutyrivibrio sp. ACV-2]|uniref:prepilin peptidase n=1 Tax=Pseudobutyrivibrio sp. ACV-2 TaxID=1520801 RepID=UPI000B7CCEDC|nr:A24 family peptidase [Pseudobutyrivibrio sp. ACV-2]
MIWSILTCGVVFDARGYRIPNQLIILGYLAGLFVNFEAYQAIGIFIFLGKAIAPVLLLFLLYCCKGMGSGDIKLFSVMSTLVGMKITVDVFVISVMLAGVAVLALFLYEGGINLKRKLHYSYYIAAGFFVTVIRMKGWSLL